MAKTMRSIIGFNQYNHNHNINFLLGQKPTKIIFDDNIHHTFVIYIDGDLVDTDKKKAVMENYADYYKVKIKYID